MFTGANSVVQRQAERSHGSTSQDKMWQYLCQTLRPRSTQERGGSACDATHCHFHWLMPVNGVLKPQLLQFRCPSLRSAGTGWKPNTALGTCHATASQQNAGLLCPVPASKCLLHTGFACFLLLCAQASGLVSKVASEVGGRAEGWIADRAA